MSKRNSVFDENGLYDPIDGAEIFFGAGVEHDFNFTEDSEGLGESNNPTAMSAVMDLDNFERANPKASDMQRLEAARAAVNRALGK